MVGCCYCAPVASRVSARQPSYFFLRRQKKVTKKKASHVRALRVPCATRSVRDTCKLASLEMSTPLNRLRRFPLQGTTPAARQSRFRGVPGRGCASLASPEWLVRFAHLAGVGLPHFSRLTAHTGTARRATTPHPSILAPHLEGNHKGCPYALTLTPSLLRPHPSLLRPHPSPLTPHPSLLTPHSSLLTPHPSLLQPHPSPISFHPKKAQTSARWVCVSA